MNFIDAAMAEGDHLSDDDFLQAMADIYKEPQVWEILEQYPQYVQDTIYIIDYDTCLQMEGLEGVLDLCRLRRHDGKYEKIHNALVNASVMEEARILKEAHILYEAWLSDGENDDDHDEQYSEQMEKLQSRTALYNDYEAFWNMVRGYIGQNRVR